MVSFLFTLSDSTCVVF